MFPLLPNSKGSSLHVTVFMNEDEIFLAYSIDEACKGYAEGNFPVGAVLVDSDKRIVDSAYNKRRTKKGFSYHAEFELILQNQTYIFNNHKDLTLYSSLEPCIMCLGLILINRLHRVVWAANDYWAGATHSYNFTSNFLRSQKCELTAPFSLVLQKQSVELIENYLKNSPQPQEIAKKILGEQLGM